MRLSSVTIRRFKGIREMTITIPETQAERTGSADFLTILGRNNVGKSSVLEAIRLALPGSDISKPVIEHFPEKLVENGPIEVEFKFNNLTDQDKERPGIRTHVHNGTYKIKKVWTAIGVQPEIWAYQPSTNFVSWPESDRTKRAFTELSTEWNAAIEAFENHRGEPLPATLNKLLKDELRDFLIENGGPLIELGEAEWVENPGGIKANVDAVLPQLIFVPALKETKAEAGVSEKSSTARQIVEAMFSDKLANNPAIQKFTEAGQAVKQLFEGAGEGQEVIRQLETEITEKIKRLIPLAAVLDFNPPDISTDLASKTILELSDGIVSTKPEHQGHGAQRALVLSLLELFAEKKREGNQEGYFRNTLLLLEEPEIYLHPQMERRMRDAVLSIARSGTAQVICTSHSPIFIDLADRHDGICILRKNEATRELSIIQRAQDLFEGDQVRNSRNRLRMLLDFDSTVSEAFFASRVCLVEGDCEVAAIDAIATKLISQNRISHEDYLLKRRELSIINCRGKWTIRAFQRVLNGFHIPHIVVHDQDGEGEEGANRAILDELQGVEERRLTHYPNFEQQIFGEEWSRDKPWKASKKISEMAEVSADLQRFFSFVTDIVPVVTEEVLAQSAAATDME